MHRESWWEMNADSRVGGKLKKKTKKNLPPRREPPIQHNVRKQKINK